MSWSRRRPDPPVPTRLHYPGRAACVAVVADTHSTPHPKLAAHLRALAPLAILHAGDIGALGVLDELAGIAPVVAVRGNIDGRGPDIPDRRIVTVEGASGVLRLMLLHIALRGPKLVSEVAKTAAAHDVSLVVCGHSHVPFVGADRGLTVFNPGSCGPRRFALPILFGEIGIGPEGVRLVHRTCEDGRPWLP